ncbi:MAG TPA: o-succinylbenzoate synthase [Salinimicrobium sp.]|nr:o-succinylbenzoate synthase [Salinimicrobium sp.]
MKANIKKYTLKFKKPGGTSRGVLTEKETFLLLIEKDGNRGIGECSLFRGLSADDRPDYQEKLVWVCEHIELGKDKLLEQLTEFPSIQFGVETAFRSLESKDPFLLFPSDFTRGNDAIEINGLVWMGKKEFMKEQIIAMIKDGFGCIKLKIGALDFSVELELLKFIRKEFSASDIEIRVDANGAFDPDEALEKLGALSEFQLHSIEQPIKQGQAQKMKFLCQRTPLPIALDEELIGVFDHRSKTDLLQMIKPQYIILKPGLIGGFKGSREWISLAEKEQIGWWVTSALESNIGLNAIAQFTYGLGNTMPQGLGTGSLYTNNFDSPLKVSRGKLSYEPHTLWNFNL